MAYSVNTTGSSFFIDVLMGWKSRHEGNVSNIDDKIEVSLNSGLMMGRSEDTRKTNAKHSEKGEIMEDNNKKIEWMSSGINNKDKTMKTNEQLPIDIPSKGKPMEGCQKKLPHLEKPNQSYIALISRAILSTPKKRLQLNDIYQWIMDTYPYYHNQDKSWRNSVRHNLSLNECFIKVGRSENGKGHYWAVHPANLEAFSHGDYQRRRARRRICRVSSVLGCSPRLPSCNLLCDAKRFCILCPPQHAYSNTNRIRDLVEHFQQQPQRFQSTAFFWPWYHLIPYL